jgi:very-short-patch-repair endonuclease
LRRARLYGAIEKHQRFIQPFGISILRFLNSEIYKNLDGVLEMIGREVLARRGETGKS